MPKPTVLARHLIAILLSVSGLSHAGETQVKAEQLFKSANGFNEQQHPGQIIYQQHCASCHEGGVPKAPHREMLGTLPITAILNAVTNGIMKNQASPLDLSQKQAVAEYLSKSRLADYQAPPPPPQCQEGAAQFDLNQAPAQSGWGYDPRRFVAKEDAGMTRGELARLKLKWAFGFPGATRARSQPTVAMGALFVGSQDGTVYAFDLDTGCVRWTSNVGAEVRTAIVVEPWQHGTKPRRPPKLFFGDLLGRVYAVNALSGELLWRINADTHANATITGSPLYEDGQLFVPVSSLESATAANPDYPCCTARGSVIAVNPDNGVILWRHYTVEQPASFQGKNSRGTDVFGPSGAAVWNNPTFDSRRGLIYFGSGQNYSSPADNNSDAVFAVDAKTGRRVWHQQMTGDDIWVPTCILLPGSCVSKTQLDVDIAASVLLIHGDDGEDVLIAGQKSGWVYGLNPDQQGKLRWKRRLGRGSLFGGVHFGMAADGSRVYVPIADTPDQWDGKPSNEPSFPGLHAIDASSGEILWRQTLKPDRCENKKFCNAGISAAVTAIDGAVIAGHLDGMLRAYDGDNGEILWQADTTVPVAGVNGVAAQGGSISGPGPAIANGYLIINSGYGFAAHEPGNALLVYSVDGK